MVPTSSFAAHLAVSAPVTGPLDFAARVEQWLFGVAQSFVDTPEERAAIVDKLLKVYDEVGLTIGKDNSLVGSMFPLMRSTVKQVITNLLEMFVKPPVPPDPVQAPIPQGAAP